MKQNRLRTIIAVAFAIISMGAWAEDVSRIAIAEIQNGTITAGTVAETGEQTVTLTVTPDNGFFIEASDIIVSKTSSTALARGATPGYAEKLKVTAVEVDNKGAGTYQFTVPDGCGAYVEATFKKMGDANGDNAVNAADIVELVNYIMNKKSEKFDEKAADVNGDGTVNAADIVAIVNIIMGL